MFERLAAQALEPRDLRAFLRLGNPLCCSALDLHFDAPKDIADGGKKAIEDASGSSNDASPVPAGKLFDCVYNAHDSVSSCSYAKIKIDRRCD